MMIVICWEQLPVYAARAIGAFVRLTGADVRVLRVAFKRFDIRGAEAMTGCPVIEVERDDRRTIAEMVGRVPDVIAVGGWASPCFIRWAREVKRHGGMTILNSDEAFTSKNFKQFLRKWRFNLLMRPIFDKYFIVGEGGRLHYGEYYGISEKRLITGLYAGDPKLFFNGESLARRSKKFVYVGHYDENKNVLRMCEAFEQGARGTDWTLEVYGGGELEDELKKRESKHVHIHGFIQAEDLGALYREARGFVLGSFSEKWGVVVHEAALSGCMLLLSDRIGARYDFARPENSAIFDPGSTDDFAAGFRKLMAFSDEQLACAQEKSLCLATRFSPEIFARNLRDAIGEK